MKIGAIGVSEILEVVAKNIKLFRVAKGLTQGKLAEKVNITGSYLGYLERGKKTPSLELLVNIADNLDVSLIDLLTSANDTADEELKKLIAIVSGKGLGPIKFLCEVAKSYFKSIEDKL